MPAATIQKPGGYSIKYQKVLNQNQRYSNCNNENSNCNNENPKGAQYARYPRKFSLLLYKVTNVLPLKKRNS